MEQLFYEADVEEHQQDERTQVDDEAVQNVLVEDLIRFILKKFATTVSSDRRKRLRSSNVQVGSVTNLKRRGCGRVTVNVVLEKSW